MRKRPLAAMAAVLAVGALGATGCGSSNNNNTTAQTTPAAKTPATPTPATSGGAEQKLNLAADPSALKYDKSTLSAKAGKVSIYLKNPAALQHDVSVEGNGVDKKSKLASTGQTVELALTLKPGKYTYYCTVPGHRAAGMEGTLTVK